MDIVADLIFGYPPESLTHLTALEEYFEVKLPDLLKQIYALGDEAHVGPLRTTSNPSLHFDFNAIRAAHSEWVGHSVIEGHKSIMKYRPDLAKLIPIGAPGNGDDVCLDYRNGSEPSVVMLDHEILTKQQEPTHPLAESFEKLMAGWYKDDKSRVRRFLRVVDE